MESTATLEAVKKLAKEIGLLLRKKQYEVLRDAMNVYISNLYNNSSERDKEFLKYLVKKYEKYGIKLDKKRWLLVLFLVRLCINL